MNKEEVKLIVLTTMEEVTISPCEKKEIMNKIETARQEMAWRCEQRREFFLSLILYITGAILLSLVSLSAQMSSIQPKHQADVRSTAAKPWWQLWDAPAKTPAQKHLP